MYAPQFFEKEKQKRNKRETLHKTKEKQKRNKRETVHKTKEAGTVMIIAAVLWNRMQSNHPERKSPKPDNISHV